ncbi:MAG: arylsulfatase [Phycisphaeraceae bacterium]
MRRKLFALLAACMLVFAARAQAAEAERPNVVFILADDLGYADLGSYGQDTIQTPHLDRLADQGIRFTQHYAGSTVCAPSRASLLLGQHTGHHYLRGNGEVALPYESRTVAKLLQSAGYRTAMIGKSSVACNDDDPDRPNALGFDHFFGLLAHDQAHYYFPPRLWRNGEEITYQTNHEHVGEFYAQDLYLDEAKTWLNEQAQTDQPFFLFYCAHLPHASITVRPEKWQKMYEDKVENDHPAHHRWYTSTDAVKAEFAGMVSRLDWEVGQLIRKLEETGQAGNTIIFFASDNGAHTEGGHKEEHFDSSGPLRGVKRDLYEGGIRVPLIVRWPGRIQPGTTTDHVSAFWDFLPTVCELAGVEAPDHTDGLSMVPVLTGRPDQQKTHPYLYWEFHEIRGRRAVRIGDFKAIQYDVNENPDAPIEVYNLAADLDESENVAAEHPEIVKAARRLFETARTEAELEQFNWPDPESE